MSNKVFVGICAVFANIAIIVLLAGMFGPFSLQEKTFLLMIGIFFLLVFCALVIGRRIYWAATSTTPTVDPNSYSARGRKVILVAVIIMTIIGIWKSIQFRQAISQLTILSSGATNSPTDLSQPIPQGPAIQIK